MTTKTCSKCKQDFPVSEFCKCKKAKDGLQYYCNSCRASFARNSYRKSKKRMLEVSRNWRNRNIKKVREKARAYYFDNRDERLKYIRQWQVKNADKKAEYSNNWLKSPALFDTFAERMLYAEPSIKRAGRFISVECTYCGKRFLPNNQSVSHRISSLENFGFGERRLYCSDGCKDVCPTYNQVDHYKGDAIGSSREVPADFRRIVFERRGRNCEKCGRCVGGLHIHHVDGYAEQPMFAADVRNVLVLCKECHLAVHRQPGCSYKEYSCKEQLIYA